MSRTIRVLPEAEGDIEVAYDWYEHQESGLGVEFVLAIEAAYEAIAENPEIYPLRQRGYRSYLVGRFPYSIYYKCDEASVYVVAVFHGSRHPLRLQSRLRRF